MEFTDLTLPVTAVAVNPGGSGIPAVFLATGGESRSSTHCGGEGRGASIVADLLVQSEIEIILCLTVVDAVC